MKNQLYKKITESVPSNNTMTHVRSQDYGKQK